MFFYLFCPSIVVFPPSSNKFPLLPLNSTIGLQKDIVIEGLNNLQVMILSSVSVKTPNVECVKI